MTPFPTQSDETVEETITSARFDDEPAWNRLLQACRPGLHRLVRQKRELILKYDLTGSDVFQEAFLKAMMDIDTFRLYFPQLSLIPTVRVAE